MPAICFTDANLTAFSTVPDNLLNSVSSGDPAFVSIFLVSRPWKLLDKELAEPEKCFSREAAVTEHPQPPAGYPSANEALNRAAKTDRVSAALNWITGTRSTSYIPSTKTLTGICHFNPHNLS